MLLSIDNLQNGYKSYNNIAITQKRRKDMNRSDCPYFSETAPVCDDGECGCLECMERIAELRKKGE